MNSATQATDDTMNMLSELEAELSRIEAEDLDVRVEGNTAVFTDTQEVTRYNAEEALFQLRQAETGSGYDGAWQMLAHCDEMAREIGADGWA